ncbi:diaminopropionate ammonia-lyase [Mesorhizobium sp. 1M-11]|uniref:diaminopropionate ammonia-lyase n=1 Tax=Mesorhizobium sp. 1M-11 TaxID=1529006 RepID=UPI0006C7537F|nr:diaminopropionate ammonia-lyase [Mesorhizobium sp. 1M-11]
MFLLNTHSDHNARLLPVDAASLSAHGVREVERFLEFRENAVATPLVALPALADALGVGAIHMKDEGRRLGLGSFKALGGSYAVVRLVLEEASRHFDRDVGFADLGRPSVRALAARKTFACATDGNHGRSVAQGAQLVGARSVIFVHGGVSDERVAAIASFGAEMIRIDGTYDETVAEAARVAEREGWSIVSDTSWPGYERIPGLVMQGYTAIAHEALSQIDRPPTHVFVQAGVGGIAAAMAGHFAETLGKDRPSLVVVEPARAACILATAHAGHVTRIDHGEPTVMAMLECYEPSLVAWRVLSRAADAFMAVEEEDAVAAMNRLAWPAGHDPAIVSGESGCVGLAGLTRALAEPDLKAALRLDATSRILLVNTEGATDPGLYEQLVGSSPAAVAGGNKEVTPA